MGDTLSTEQLATMETERRQKINNFQNQTRLDEIDVVAIEECFKEHSNNDELNEEQFNKALQHLEEYGLNKISNSELSARMFHIYDTNGDGVLDFDEFLPAFSLLCGGSIDDKVDLTFRIYDKDNSGTIDREEMSSIITASFHAGLKLLASAGELEETLIDLTLGLLDMCIELSIDFAFDSFDSDGDGVLTKEEFKVWAMNDENVTATVDGQNYNAPMTLFSLSPDQKASLPSGSTSTWGLLDNSTKPPGKPYLHVHVHSGVDLVSKDRNGYSDPFCKIQVGNDKKYKRKTVVRKKTLNPVWKENLKFIFLSTRAQENQTVTIEIFDKDKLGVDRMGKVVVNLDDDFAYEQLQQYPVQPVKPKDRVSGYLNLAFARNDDLFYRFPNVDL
eukprot:TRINITY_DN11207_c0_g1_i1.p1 TRINITY_DN11207_c0_g1~~TRINITY_DN11207_c0_g1_i1.p1  ORF type:complete len:389 (+),score=92.66 TRINITY_DN11207_c0_g1_i1:34-1200(+)